MKMMKILKKKINIRWNLKIYLLYYKEFYYFYLNIKNF